MAEGDLDTGDARSRAQQAILGMMVDKIRQDDYPSPTMMNIVESHMTEEQLPEYLDMLMEKIQSSQYPSMDMIRRVLKLT
jgi:uncharacterized protein (DUF2132 family)